MLVRTLALTVVLSVSMTGLAEAKRMRFGGSSSAVQPAKAADGKSGPGLRAGVAAGAGLAGARAARGSSQPAAAETDPDRVPFPTPAAIPAPQLATVTPASGKPWCEGQSRVGGFCVVN